MSATVVVVQALFRHLQPVPPDLQHLHRFRNLRTGRRGDLPRIPRFPRRRHTRNHSVRRRLRRRTHVSLTTLFLSPAFLPGNPETRLNVAVGGYTIPWYLGFQPLKL